jgi:hypothetical protein
MPLRGLPEDVHTSHYLDAPSKPPYRHCRRGCRSYGGSSRVAGICPEPVGSIRCRGILRDCVTLEHAFAQRPSHVYVACWWHACGCRGGDAPTAARIRLHGQHECASSPEERDAPAQPACVSRSDISVVHLNCERLASSHYITPEWLRFWSRQHLPITTSRDPTAQVEART